MNQIIDDVNAARIYAGFHYRSTLVRSNRVGIAIANWVNRNMMTVLAESALGPDNDDNERHHRTIPVKGTNDPNIRGNR